MNLTHLIAPAAVLIAFTLISAPAQAEQRGSDNRGRSVAHGRAVDGTVAGRRNRPQDRVRIDQPANRMDLQRRDGGYQQSREGGYRQNSRVTAAPRVVGPH